MYRYTDLQLVCVAIGLIVAGFGVCALMVSWPFGVSLMAMGSVPIIIVWWQRRTGLDTGEGDN